MLDDGLRPKVEDLIEGRGHLIVRTLARTEGVDVDGDGLGDTDGVRQLNLTTRRNPGVHEIPAPQRAAYAAERSTLVASFPLNDPRRALPCLRTYRR